MDQNVYNFVFLFTRFQFELNRVKLRVVYHYVRGIPVHYYNAVCEDNYTLLQIMSSTFNNFTFFSRYDHSISVFVIKLNKIGRIWGLCEFWECVRNKLDLFSGPRPMSSQLAGQINPEIRGAAFER